MFLVQRDCLIDVEYRWYQRIKSNLDISLWSLFWNCQLLVNLIFYFLIGTAVRLPLWEYSSKFLIYYRQPFRNFARWCKRLLATLWQISHLVLVIVCKDDNFQLFDRGLPYSLVNGQKEYFVNLWSCCPRYLNRPVCIILSDPDPNFLVDRDPTYYYGMFELHRHLRGTPAPIRYSTVHQRGIAAPKRYNQATTRYSFPNEVHLLFRITVEAAESR